MEETMTKLSKAYEYLFNIGVKGVDVQNMYIALQLIKSAYDELKAMGGNSNGGNNKTN